MKRYLLIILISILLSGILSTQNCSAQQSAYLYTFVHTTEGASIDGAHCVVKQNGNVIIFDSILTNNSIIPSFDLTNGPIHFSLVKPFYNSVVNNFINWGEDIFFETDFGFAKCAPISLQINNSGLNNTLTWDAPVDCGSFFNTNQPNPYCQGYDLYRNGILLAENIQENQYRDQLDMEMACVYRLYAKYSNGLSDPATACVAMNCNMDKRTMGTQDINFSLNNFDGNSTKRVFDWNNSECTSAVGFPHQYWGAFCKWPAESFIGKDREYIRSIAFYAGDAGNEYSVKLYQDVEGKVYQQKVESYIPNQWNEVTLKHPFALVDADLTFGVMIKDQTGNSLGVNDEVNTWVGNSDLYLNNNVLESYSIQYGPQSFCLKAIAEPNVSHNSGVTDGELKTTSSNTDLTIDNSIQIYPNPTHDFAKVTLSVGIRLISVYDMNGRLLFKEELGGLCEYNLDLSKLRKGMYYLKINTVDKRIMSEKVIMK
jgi:hypothetical protein